MNHIAELAPRTSNFGVYLETNPDAYFANAENLANFRSLINEKLVFAIKYDAPPSHETLANVALALGLQPPWPTSFIKTRKPVPGYNFMTDIDDPHEPGNAPKYGWLGQLHFDGESAYSVIDDLVGQRRGPNQYRDMAAVYQELPDRLRRLVTGKIAIHGHNPSSTYKGLATSPPLDLDRPLRREALVVRHPRTGVPVLRPPRSPNSLVEGMSQEDSREILEELWNWTWASPSRFEFWSGAGLFYVWEGTRVAHNNPPFDMQDEARREVFFTVPGDWKRLEAY